MKKKGEEYVIVEGAITPESLEKEDDKKEKTVTKKDVRDWLKGEK